MNYSFVSTIPQFDLKWGEGVYILAGNKGLLFMLNTLRSIYPHTMQLISLTAQLGGAMFFFCFFFGIFKVKRHR